MQDQQMTTIILAAIELGGMGSDYFENKTRHLLPIANKPLIQHLIEAVDKTFDKRDRIGKKYIVIEEKVEKNEKIKPCEEVYNSIFGDRIGDDIEIVGQESLTQVGTFETVRRYIEEDKEKDRFPLLVLYGDTLVEEKFLECVIDRYYKEEEESKIIWGLVKSGKERGKFVVTKQIDLNNDFARIYGNSIINIFEYPVKVQKDESYDFLRDTGIMVISEDAWNDIDELIKKIHRPSSLGLFSFSNILKQALVLKDVDIEGIREVDIKIIGIVASEDHWHEANYPWEILELNKIKISELVNSNLWTGEEEEIGQKSVFIPEKVEFTMSNGTRIKGPCILGKNIEIQDYAIIENSYIGDGCKIGSNTLIHDSTLVKDIIIHHGAIIEKSIIMENSEIYYHSDVLHSIIGKKVTIGSGVRTPCQRLKNADGEPVGVTYFSDIGIKRTNRFGAIIGDYCQIGSGTVIHPGRRVGKGSKIHANCEILKNIKPDSNIKNEDVVKGYD